MGSGARPGPPLVTPTEQGPSWAERLEPVLRRHVAAGTVPGATWLVDDEGRVEQGAVGSSDRDGTVPADVDAVLRVASVTKCVMAVLALRLVQDGLLDLDEPVDRLLPELASPVVLRHAGAALDDVVPAHRPITGHDLLTLRGGHGFDVTSEGATPYSTALLDPALGLGPPKPGSPLDPDAWIEHLGRLPLLAHPGEQWLYDTSYAVLGVLLARAGGLALPDLLDERVLGPLGMSGTGFLVPAQGLYRLPPAHSPGDDGLVVDDPGGAASAYATVPAFAAGNGGLVSTLADLHALTRMLRDGGVHEGRRILTERSVRAMTTDTLDATTRERSPAASVFLGDAGWGLGGGISADGRYGWVGYGVSFSLDPALHHGPGRIVLVATQRMPPSTDLLADVDAATGTAQVTRNGA